MLAADHFPWGCMFSENKQKPGMMPQCDLSEKDGREQVLS